MVLTHSADRPDMEIIINGPYKGYEFLDEIEKVMQEPRWTKALPRDSRFRVVEAGVTRYSDSFSNTLSNFMRSVRNYTFLNIQDGFGSGMTFASKDWCQEVKGNVCNLNYATIIEKDIDRAKLAAKKIKEKMPETQHQIQAPPKLKGYGTFFYPPIWVGKIPEKTFKQKVEGVYYPFAAKAFDSTFDGKKVVVDFDGFIGIEDENRENALRTLNTLYGVALISGYTCFAARESEMADITIEPTSLKISSTSINISSPRTQLMNLGFTNEILHPKKVELAEEKITEFIKNAEKAIKNNDLTEQVLFLLEGYTHHNNSEYSQAFIINWLIVERLLFELWETLLQENKIIGRRKDKLTNTNQWGADYVLETLNIDGTIDNATYALLIELKNKRNNFVHRGASIDKQTSEKLLNLSFKIVKDNLTQALSD